MMNPVILLFTASADVSTTDPSNFHALPGSSLSILDRLLLHRSEVLHHAIVHRRGLRTRRRCKADMRFCVGACGPQPRGASVMIRDCKRGTRVQACSECLACVGARTLGGSQSVGKRNELACLRALDRVHCAAHTKRRAAHTKSVLKCAQWFSEEGGDAAAQVARGASWCPRRTGTRRRCPPRRERAACRPPRRRHRRSPARK